MKYEIDERLQPALDAIRNALDRPDRMTRCLIRAVSTRFEETETGWRVPFLKNYRATEPTDPAGHEIFSMLERLLLNHAQTGRMVVVGARFVSFSGAGYSIDVEIVPPAKDSTGTERRKWGEDVYVLLKHYALNTEGFVKDAFDEVVDKSAA
jgi:hypothetical protein